MTAATYSMSLRGSAGEREAPRAESIAQTNRMLATLPIGTGEERLFAGLRLRLPGPRWQCRDSPLSEHANGTHLMLQTKGDAALLHGERRMVLGAGDWIFCSGRTRLSFAPEDGVERLLLILPEGGIEKRLLPPGGLVSLSRSSGAARVAACFVLSIAGSLQLIDPSRHSDLATATLQLVSMALEECVPRLPRPSMREITSARIKAYICANIRKPSLNLESIALALGCTKRCLHMAFEDEQHTLNEYIRNLRLDHCRRELLQPANARWPVTAVAFSFGFNNAAHFSRAFRGRFGMSPTEMRNQTQR